MSNGSSNSLVIGLDNVSWSQNALNTCRRCRACTSDGIPVYSKYKYKFTITKEGRNIHKHCLFDAKVTTDVAS
jgi:hypothetical protein